MTKIFIFSILCFGVSFSTFSQEKLSDIFSNNEIEELNIIISFFDGLVCEDSKGDIGCYESWIQKLANNGVETQIENTILYEKQKKLYNEISKKTLNQIWSKCPVLSGEEKVTISMCPNMNGKYIRFLKCLGKKEFAINEYVNSVLEAGDFLSIPYPVSFLNVDGKIRDMKISTENLKLLIAIHCLSISNNLYQ